jgi:hypothetical protein
MGKDYTTHPAYGMVAFDRVSGDPGRMFGSSLQTHGQFVRLTIRQGQRAHDLGQDWLMGANRVPHIEVWLSAAQFAELLTTMNVGDGVPCTIKEVNGMCIEMPQDEKTEVDRAYDAAKEHMQIFPQEVRAKMARAQELLAEKGPMKVAARKEVSGVLREVLMTVDANFPFALKQFQSAAEKTTTHAKAEFDSLVMHAITTRGLAALQLEVPPQKQLEEPDVAFDKCVFSDATCRVCGDSCCDNCAVEGKCAACQTKEGDGPNDA